MITNSEAMLNHEVFEAWTGSLSSTSPHKGHSTVCSPFFSCQPPNGGIAFQCNPSALTVSNGCLGGTDGGLHAEKNEDTEARTCVRRTSLWEASGAGRGEEVRRTEDSSRPPPCDHTHKAIEARKACMDFSLPFKGPKDLHTKLDFSFGDSLRPKDANQTGSMLQYVSRLPPPSPSSNIPSSNKRENCHGNPFQAGELITRPSKIARLLSVPPSKKACSSAASHFARVGSENPITDNSEHAFNLSQFPAEQQQQISSPYLQAFDQQSQQLVQDSHLKSILPSVGTSSYHSVSQSNSSFPN